MVANSGFPIRFFVVWRGRLSLHEQHSGEAWDLQDSAGGARGLWPRVLGDPADFILTGVDGGDGGAKGTNADAFFHSEAEALG